MCGGRYVQFRIGRRTKEAKAAVFAVWTGQVIKLYVVPVRDFMNVSSFMLPFNGKYAEHGKKPKRDWTAYENAWEFVKRPQLQRDSFTA